MSSRSLRRGTRHSQSKRSVAVPLRGRSRLLTPTPSDGFTFGLWTAGNPGQDPFGLPTRNRLAPAEVVDVVGKMKGARGVNFHDDDLVPFGASPREAATIKRDFERALVRNKLAVPMATTNLFSQPVFKDGAFTSNNAEIRAFAIRKAMLGMDTGAEFGAKIYVFWGGREGVESDATKDPILAIARFREAINILCEYSISKGYGYKFAFEAKPNEPRGHMYFAVTGAYLALIPTLKYPDMCGVNPERAHETMAGLNFVHAVAQSLEAGKLFHVDLNDQEIGRYDQDFRFGAADPKSCFFLVRLLENAGYKGPKHFDAHAYRTADLADVIEWGRGCMYNYKALAAKARAFDADPRVIRILKTVNGPESSHRKLTRLLTGDVATALRELSKVKVTPKAANRLAALPLPYEKLDQLAIQHIMGTAN